MSLIKTYLHNQMTTKLKSISLEQLQTAHPSGVYSERHGCYYFVDYDGDLGYFIEYTNGNFESEPQWVDLDTLADDEREECENIAAHIAIRS